MPNRRCKYNRVLRQKAPALNRGPCPYILQWLTLSNACPVCGYQNLQQARFCQSCGRPVPVQPSQPFIQTSPHYYTPPRSGMGSGTTVLIIAIVLIVVLVVAVAAAVFVFYTPALISRVSPRTGPVAVTGLF